MRYTRIRVYTIFRSYTMISHLVLFSYFYSGIYEGGVQAAMDKVDKGFGEQYIDIDMKVQNVLCHPIMIKTI